MRSTLHLKNSYAILLAHTQRLYNTCMYPQSYSRISFATHNISNNFTKNAKIKIVQNIYIYIYTKNTKIKFAKIKINNNKICKIKNYKNKTKPEIK